ncbi:MAG TPA: phospholipase D-like domain-containing protein [Gemmatimonadales bacterium]
MTRHGLDEALDRAAGARAIGGNAVRHIVDSRAALEEMLALIRGARRSVHFENYIIRGDATGQRFAAALAERARAGIPVRVLYDALGSRLVSRSLWREARRAGVEVRAFNPLLSAGPFDITRRNHRKLLTVDGDVAMVGGVCIGDEWAGDPVNGRRPWRDTIVSVRGPAATVLDGTFASVWARTGAPLPPDERSPTVPEAGECRVRVIEGVPGESRIYRTMQLLVAIAAERLWVTDAYLVAPPPLFAGLADAARGGVDVRLLLPGWSDAPVVRTLTRIGYRQLLGAGVRIYEWVGPMLHAKATIVDRRWVRVGSTNLNVSSLIGNYELDVLVESAALADDLGAQFRRDVAQSREVTLQAQAGRRQPRLVGTPVEEPGAPHQRTGRERVVAAAVTLRQVAGGLRHALTAIAVLTLAGLGALLVVFPRAMSLVLAACAFWLAAGLTWYGLVRRRREGS